MDGHIVSLGTSRNQVLTGKKTAFASLGMRSSPGICVPGDPDFDVSHVPIMDEASINGQSAK